MAHCYGVIIIILATICAVTIVTADPIQKNDETSPKPKNFWSLLCSHYNHSTMDGGMTCCNQDLIVNNIGHQKNSGFWQECRSIKSTGNETAIGASWRVYTCVLSKLLPSGQHTISFAAFTNISIESFPGDTRTTILDLLKNVSASSNQPWMSNEISLSNYENIDKIRAQYFDIEKQACGEDESTTAISTHSAGKPWKQCNLREELLHRDGACCGNYTIPFRDGSFQHFDTTGCNQTMAKLYEKSGYHWLLELQCDFACHLVGKSIISIEDILNLKESDVPPMELIAKDQYAYLPAKTQTKMAVEGLDYYNSTIVTKFVESYLRGMGNTTALEEKRSVLYKCGVYKVALNRLMVPYADCRE